MPRSSIPRKTKDAVLAEYSHQCAICGSANPHIHHVDEDNSNNQVENLLPLCPNCHLRDQHNPTRKLDIPKLMLFRRHKDPAILKPQFHPIYVRQAFLDEVESGEGSTLNLERSARELTELVESLEMGSFYGKRLQELIAPPPQYLMMVLSDGPNPEFEKRRREANRNYRAQLINNRAKARDLLVELLRYQRWANEA